jgi:hypothetical protein
LKPGVREQVRPGLVKGCLPGDFVSEILLPSGLIIAPGSIAPGSIAPGFNLGKKIINKKDEKVS